MTFTYYIVLLPTVKDRSASSTTRNSNTPGVALQLAYT